MPFMVLAYSIGDIDGNGEVKTADYLLIRKHMLSSPKLTGDALKRADVNNDGKVSASDYNAVRKIIMSSPASVSATPKPKATATPTPKPTATQIVKKTNPITLTAKQSWTSTYTVDAKTIDFELYNGDTNGDNQ